ncbi:MAG: class I SAM-dependent methyltransferase [Solirubrobacteraceae bacterium]
MSAAFAFGDAADSAPAIRQLLRLVRPGLERASLVVHPNDDMWCYLADLTPFAARAAGDYFRTGAMMIPLIERIADWRFGGLERVGSFLDFASGYGRGTRFLVERLPAAAVMVGEIQTDALAFLAEQFGVETLRSTTDPADLPGRQRFDVVFVASLFTHLPRHRFAPWLTALWERVAPGGVLVFSVHDETVPRAGGDWEDGFAFFPASEVPSLDVADYGSSYTTEAFVRQQLAASIGDEAADAIRMPGVLFNVQDVWVVARGPRAVESLSYDAGPFGAIEVIHVDGATITVEGWALDKGLAVPGATPHAITGIEILLDDELVAVGQTGRPRPGLAEAFHRPDEPAFENGGWIASGKARRHISPRNIVAATAVCECGVRRPLEVFRVRDALTAQGAVVPPYAMERRMRVAGQVYERGGLRALAALAPTIAANELRRLAGDARVAVGRWRSSSR